MSRLSNSARLRLKIELVLPELATVGKAIFYHPKVKALYPDYLYCLHTMIRATIPLMETALARTRVMVADLLASKLGLYFEHHIPEEMHHDEWLLDDLEGLGFDRNEILRRPPSPTVARMVGAQYYWIHHYHPVLLLGYIMVMEGYPATVQQLDARFEPLGFPREAFRTLYKHAEFDHDHRDELHDLLDELPLSPELTGLLGANAIHTVRLASIALREIVDRL